jgi:hypothetical protein
LLIDHPSRKQTQHLSPTASQPTFHSHQLHASSIDGNRPYSHATCIL